MDKDNFVYEMAINIKSKLDKYISEYQHRNIIDSEGHPFAPHPNPEIWEFKLKVHDLPRGKDELNKVIKELDEFIKEYDVKAPKNELQPLEYSELIKLMIEKGSPKIGESRVKLARNIIAKFGSSGKRSLSQYDLSVFLRKQPFLSHLQADLLAERVVKEFSTDEVSEEVIDNTIINFIKSKDFFSGLDNSSKLAMIRHLKGLAKAIKRELEKK